MIGAAVGTGGGELAGRQQEGRAAAPALEGLDRYGFLKAAPVCHGDEEILLTGG